MPADTAPAASFNDSSKEPKTKPLHDAILRVLDKAEVPLSVSKIQDGVNANNPGAEYSYQTVRGAVIHDLEAQVESLTRAQLEEHVGRDVAEAEYPREGVGKPVQNFYRLKPTHHDKVQNATQAARRFKQTGFIDQNSVFEDAGSMDGLWSADNFARVAEVLATPGLAEAKSLPKALAAAMADAPVETRQLMAELYLLYLLPLNHIAKAGKLDAVMQLLPVVEDADAAPSALPVELDRLLEDSGALTNFPNYGSSRLESLRYLAELGRKFAQLSEEERRESLEPGSIEATLRGDTFQGGLPSHRAPAMVRALQFLFAPEAFPPVVDGDDLKSIIGSYPEHQAELDATASAHFQVGQLREILREKTNEPRFEFDLERDEFAEANLEPVVKFTPREAEKLNVSPGWLDTVAELLTLKKQIIFDGPPGTGKTFLATRIARKLAGPENTRIVQFHPSYGYEDFFEGYRPCKGGQTGALEMELTPGPLREFALRASTKTDENFVLILDEMNRGNLPRIFGELYYLLEHRDEKVPLMYSPESDFTIPGNLYIIGTMNSADHSVTEVDAALRRRFAIFPLNPLEEPTNDILRRWSETHTSYARLPQIWTTLNHELLRLGVQVDQLLGPSYFLERRAKTAADVKKIWDYEITPQLRALFPGEPEKVAELTLAAIEAKLDQDAR